ncbi:MAG: class I SAM-dependent methyltransferase, partial [Geothrix sp.]|nr:class I SAM-dependent methyltransferase [Geothrix sp.]
MPTTSSPPKDRRLRVLLAFAHQIHRGRLTLELPDGSRQVIEGSPGTEASFVLKDARAVRKLIIGGSLGLSEAYLDGLWDSPDLRAVMRLAAENEAEWERLLAGRPLMRALARLAHKLRPNTRRGARRNIEEHYDLGNEFYAQWLDP